MNHLIIKKKTLTIPILIYIAFQSDKLPLPPLRPPESMFISELALFSSFICRCTTYTESLLELGHLEGDYAIRTFFETKDSQAFL